MQIRSNQLINKTKGIQKIFTARWKKVPILKIKSHYARISYIMLMMYKEIQQKEKRENYQNIFYFEIWLPWISSFARMKKNSVNLYSVLYIPKYTLVCKSLKKYELARKPNLFGFNLKGKPLKSWRQFHPTKNLIG